MNYFFSYWYTYLQTSSKFLQKFLAPSTANEYTVIISFHFAEEILNRIPTYTWLV